MNSEEFKVVVDGCIENIKKVLESKSQEYSSKEDKLHNFVAATKLMRCKTKEYALLGMLNKHLVSVIDMIVKYEQEGILPSAKLVNEKIGDSINYFVLLKACFMEDIYNKENDKTSDYTVGDIRNIREQIKKVDEGNLCVFCAKDNNGCSISKAIRAKKIQECEGFVDLRYQQAAMANRNNDKQDVETLKKEQSLIANSLWNNPRKRLVVEKLRTMLKPMFIYLTDNNKFIDYEGIKGILNRAELEKDSVPDDFIYDVLVAIERLEAVSEEGYQKRKETVTNIIQIMLHPKYKIGDEIWSVTSNLDESHWVVRRSMIIDSYCWYESDKEIGYCSCFGETASEKYCFKTKKEAAEYCDKKNNEIKK